MAKTNESSQRRTDAEYPVSIFGKLPAGFTLERQSVYTLAQWHSNALKAISELKDDADEKEADAAWTATSRAISVSAARIASKISRASLPAGSGGQDHRS